MFTMFKHWRVWKTMAVYSLFVAPSVLAADLPEPKQRGAAVEREVDLFAAEEAKQITVDFIAPAADNAWVRIHNNTDQTLKVRLPDVFAGVPVLAQFGQPGLAQGGPFGGGNLGGGNPFGGNLQGGNQLGGNLGGQGQGGNQGLGGGFPQGGGNIGNGIGNIPGGAGNAPRGVGFFRVAPGKVGKLAVTTICLEHGKPDPNSRVKYQLVKLEQFTSDPRIADICKKLAEKKISQNVAQCVAWHFTDGLSWEMLASKNRVESKYTGSVKFFTASELEQAIVYAEQLRKLEPGSRATSSEPSTEFSASNAISSTNL